jgi:hypothetical protein
MVSLSAMPRCLLIVPLLVVAGCPSSQPINSPGGGGGGATVPDDRAAALLVDTEQKLLSTDFLTIESKIEATGAVEASVSVDVVVHEAKVRFEAHGTFAGKKFRASYVSDGTHTNLGFPPAAHAREAVLIGLTRMGLLHNVAVLMNRRPPDHAGGGVAKWVRARKVAFAQPRIGPAANESAVRFEIVVGGKKSGTAELRIHEARQVPLGRVQTVEFPSGTMTVKEIYRISTTGAPPANPDDPRGPFMTRARCKMDSECLIYLCSTTDRHACTWAAIGMIHGIGAKQDAKRGENMLSYACNAGDPHGCALLASRLRDPKGDWQRRRDLHDKATKMWKRECKAKVPGACEAAKAWRGRRLNGVTKRVVDRLLCQHDRPLACDSLVNELRGPDHADERNTVRAKAEALLAAGCPAKPKFCYRLGRLRSGTASLEPLRAACKTSHRAACELLIERLAAEPSGATELATLRSEACSKAWRNGAYCVAAGDVASGADKVRYYEQACKQGSVKGCRKGAAELTRRRSSRKQQARAAELLGIACASHEDKEICDRYFVVAKRAGLLRRRATATRVHQRMCLARGRIPSCMVAGKRVKKPYDLYNRACEGKNARGCWLAARAARKDPDNKSSENGAYERGCELGDLIACWKAGKLVKGCADGKGSHDACLAKARSVTNYEDHAGEFTGDRNRWCAKACKAWKKRDRRERRASRKNPARAKICRKVKACR